MAKQVTAMIKLQCPGGSATPAPPVGPALGQHGVNIGKFVKDFNDKTFVRICGEKSASIGPFENCGKNSP